MKNRSFLLSIIALFFSLFYSSCSDHDNNEEEKKLLTEINILQTGPGLYVFEYDDQNRIENFMWMDVYIIKGDTIREVFQKHFFEYNHEGKLSKYSVYNNSPTDYYLDFYYKFEYEGNTVFCNKYNHDELCYNTEFLTIDEKGFLKQQIDYNYHLYTYDSNDNLIKSETYRDGTLQNLVTTTLYEYDNNKSIFINQNLTPWFWVWNRYRHLRYFNSVGKNNGIKEILQMYGTEQKIFERKFIIDSEGYPIGIYEGNERRENVFKYKTIR